jgi:hypothetical protein
VPKGPKKKMTATYQDFSKKLGQLLVERGWVTGEQLIRAIQSQRLLGGRIGTCLLEMDVVDEDQLLDTLSLQLRVPAAGVESLRGIDDEVLGLVPPKLAARGLVVPFAASRTELKVATLQVRNLALLDELSFAANRRIAPHIASEVRIFEALEKYYGFEIPRRFGHLLDRLNRSRYLWDESTKLLLGETEEAEVVWKTPEEAFEAGRDDAKFAARLITAPAARSSFRQVPTPAGEIGFAAAAPPPAAARPAPPPPAPPAAPLPATELYTTRQLPSFDPDPPVAGKVEFDGKLTLELVDQLLSQENDVDRIAEIVLRFASGLLNRAALFRVRQQQIVAWQARIANLDGELFGALEISRDAPSLFLELFAGAPFVTGKLAPMPAHRQLVATWGGEWPREVVLIPLRVRDRLVGILYGDRGGAGFEGEGLDELKRLAVKASMALELCILRRKLKTV